MRGDTIGAFVSEKATGLRQEEKVGHQAIGLPEEMDGTGNGGIGAEIIPREKNYAFLSKSLSATTSLIL